MVIFFVPFEDTYRCKVDTWKKNWEKKTRNNIENDIFVKIENFPLKCIEVFILILFVYPYVHCNPTNQFSDNP